MDFIKFLTSAKDKGFFDTVDFTKDSVNITSGKDRLSMKFVGSAVLMWGNKEPSKLYEYRGSKIPQIVSKLAIQYFHPVFSGKCAYNKKIYSGSVIPKGTCKEGVIFCNKAGKEWVLSSANEPNVTLAFYELLGKGNMEEYALQLPQLLPRDQVKIASSVQFDAAKALAEFEPLMISSSMCPRVGVTEVLGKPVMSSDKANRLAVEKAINLFSAMPGREKYLQAIMDEYGCRREEAEEIAEEQLASSRKPVKSGWESEHHEPGLPLEGDSETMSIQAYCFRNGCDVDKLVARLQEWGQAEDENTELPVSDLKSAADTLEADDYEEFDEEIESSRLRMQNEALHYTINSNNKYGRHTEEYLLDKVQIPQIVSAFDKFGVTYETLRSGVNFDKRESKELFDFLKSSHCGMKPMAVKPLNISAKTDVFSGAKLQKELSAWGLEDKNHVFQSLKLVQAEF